ncbi:hypothetical protein EU805_03340 [Salipiger sp. IMCC34102]|uniref:hypothetical protein n=1 Tax=Salipiger sp. IMCC34102 TaxID=2510647 RepID=UPI00101CC23C|nr:hypothetical protein [Salipiger sp. IMCC34102]RYH04418.1 hypothetical protein EU805_03340 [Salipiger sp. IMCC34102]
MDIASLEWETGAASTQAQWAELELMAEDTGATLLMWEAAPPSEALARAEELGLTSVVFNPMTNRPASTDFIEGISQGLSKLGDAAEQ